MCSTNAPVDAKGSLKSDQPDQPLRGYKASLDLSRVLRQDRLQALHHPGQAIPRKLWNLLQLQ